jgi:hypothetical protein
VAPRRDEIGRDREGRAVVALGDDGDDQALGVAVREAGEETRREIVALAEDADAPAREEGLDVGYAKTPGVFGVFGVFGAARTTPPA